MSANTMALPICPYRKKVELGRVTVLQLLVGLHNELYTLANRNDALAKDRPVHAGVVLIHSHNRLQDRRVLLCCVRVKVDHHTSLVTQGNADSGS